MPSVCDTNRKQARTLIRQEAGGLGFDSVGFTSATSVPDAGARLEAFVAAGHHGSMAWMRDRLHHRKTPCNLWPEAKSVIALGMNYGPATDPRLLLAHPTLANISVYARGKDYHDTVKKKLKALGRFMARAFNCQLKVFVDTAPVMEKPLSAAAGLGWQGKHTNLVSQEFGSWLFLGVIYTDMELISSHAAESRSKTEGSKAHNRNTHDTDTYDVEAGRVTASCGSCTACLTACPTKAFPAPYQLDARRCLSYLSIEHKGPIPLEFRQAMGNRIYGCDDCLAACPWNKFACTASEADFFARVELGAPRLRDLLQLDDASFRQIFSGSPIKRIGRDRFIRNCLIAAGNSKSTSLKPYVEALRADPDEVVREAADWAAAHLHQIS